MKIKKNYTLTVAIILSLFLFSFCSTEVIEVNEYENKKNVEVIINLLEDSNYEIREAAAYSLGRLLDKRAIVPLIKALHDSHSYVRSAAIESLSSYNDKRAIVAISKRLRDKDSVVRIYAIDAITRLQGKKAIPSLRKISTRDPSRYVRKWAKNRLTHLKTIKKDKIEILVTDEVIKKAIQSNRVNKTVTAKKASKSNRVNKTVTAKKASKSNRVNKTVTAKKASKSNRVNKTEATKKTSKSNGKNRAKKKLDKEKNDLTIQDELEKD